MEAFGQTFNQEDHIGQNPNHFSIHRSKKDKILYWDKNEA